MRSNGRPADSLPNRRGASAGCAVPGSCGDTVAASTRLPSSLCSLKSVFSPAAAPERVEGCAPLFLEVTIDYR